MQVFKGPRGVRIYQAIVLRSALRRYAPDARQKRFDAKLYRMLKLAESITGNTYKRGDYLRAADDIGKWLELEKIKMDATDLPF